MEPAHSLREEVKSVWASCIRSISNEGREFLVTWLLESEPLSAETEDNDAGSLAKTNQRDGTTDRF